ncbi:MAG: insulinase family protein, partial [Spirochaetia bacterium]|nr:insulinase family protein [Spirochaetia bacterium]
MILKTGFSGLKKHNGQKLLVTPNNSFLTNIQILTSAGSTAEDESIQGMAHILEHMFFKGSKKRPGGTAISRAANDIGGKMNAYTTYDHTVYYITVLNDKFEEGFDILADMYQNPLFPEEEFAKELNPILSEFREREDDPDGFLMERALQAYLGENYHPVIGTEKSISSANVEKMHDFKNRFYGGDNTMISVSGGVDESVILKSVEKYFSSPSPKETPKNIEVNYNPGEIILHKKGIQEAYYTLFYPALPYSHEDRYRQDMMNYMLGGNDSSLLFERIREELGMSCYGIYSWSMRHNGFSLLAISCGIAADELDLLHTEVETQIQRISNEKLEKERLERSRASLRTSIAAKSETSAGMNSMISVPVLRGETEDPVQKSLNAIESISLDDI